MDKITVRISFRDIPTRGGPIAYFDAVQKKLAAAGVEFSDGEPVGGTLSRRDDPDDFGVSIWTFTPNTYVSSHAAYTEQERKWIEIQ